MKDELADVDADELFADEAEVAACAVTGSAKVENSSVAAVIPMRIFLDTFLLV